MSKKVKGKNRYTTVFRKREVQYVLYIRRKNFEGSHAVQLGKGADRIIA
jgi:hypothetical protein